MQRVKTHAQRYVSGALHEKHKLLVLLQTQAGTEDRWKGEEEMQTDRDRLIHRERERERERQTDRQTDRDRDREKERETERKRLRETERKGGRV